MHQPNPISFGIAGDLPNQAEVVRVLTQQLDDFLQPGQLEVLVEETFLGAKKSPEGEQDDPYRCDNGPLFRLARALKKHFRPEERDGLGRPLAPLALLFVELYSREVPLVKRTFDWTDENEVKVVFELAWDDAKLAEGENVVAEAYKRAQQSPCTNESGVFGRVLSVGYYLYERSGYKSFILPLTEANAEICGVSKQILGKYIELARRRGYFQIVAGAIPHRQARKLRFDTQHPNLIPSFKR